MSHKNNDKFLNDAAAEFRRISEVYSVETCVKASNKKASSDREKEVTFGRRSVKTTDLPPEALERRRDRIARIKRKIAEGKYTISKEELLKAMFC